MAISILCTNDICVVSVNEQIMQRSKNARVIKFYVPTEYETKNEQYSINDSTVTLSLEAPNGKQDLAILEAEDVSGKTGYTLYKYELDSLYTTSAGTLKVGLSATYTSVDTGTTFVRKYQECSLTITPIADFMNTVSDDSLSKLDQEITKLNRIATAIYNAGEGTTNTAVDLEVTDKNLHLINSVGLPIGDGVSYSDTKTLNTKIVDSLPTTDIDPSIIYLVLSEEAKGEDEYDEYIYITDRWERMGSRTSIAEQTFDDSVTPADIDSIFD